MFSLWKSRPSPHAGRVEPTLAPIRNEGRRTYRDMEEFGEAMGASAGSYAGPVVTTATAMKTSAVYACVNLIAGTIASLPLQIYEKKDGAKERVHDHPVGALLNSEPCALMTSVVFWESLLTSLLLEGDGLAFISRSRGGAPLDLFPVKEAWWNEKKEGRLRYYIQMDSKIVAFDQDDILHIPGIGFNGLRGLSPIKYAAKQAVGLALAAEEFSARFFSNNARPDIVIVYPNEMKVEKQAAVRDYWARKHQGLDNSHKPAILTEGADIKTLSMSAEDAQLIESRRFQIADICRIFGVPPFMVGETDKSTSWGSGIEQQMMGFTTFTLGRYLRKIEQELKRKLFAHGPFFAEFNVDGLQRGDSKTRSEFYTRALGSVNSPAWMTQNEVRSLENRPPIEGGDTLYQPVPGGGKRPDEKQTDEETF